MKYLDAFKCQLLISILLSGAALAAPAPMLKHGASLTGEHSTSSNHLVGAGHSTTPDKLEETHKPLHIDFSKLEEGKVYHDIFPGRESRFINGVLHTKQTPEAIEMEKKMLLAMKYKPTGSEVLKQKTHPKIRVLHSEAKSPDEPRGKHQRS
jgi:hypothetical protein